MIEIKGDLWAEGKKADAICITTNGFVKKNGAAVMGRGCALEARQKFPGIDFILGKELLQYNTRVFEILTYNQNKEHSISIVSFPVKYNFWEKASLTLIEKSAKELVEAANNRESWKKILIPRPGCGNGKLDWNTEVKPILEGILDNRFYIISKGV